jgi:TetR/AcrR family transcriptional repressor of nem operon
MGRPKTFDEEQVIASAAELFARAGYAATSVDDLLQALGMHRGSLYQAFGSKRGLFVTALRRAVTAGAAGPEDGSAPVLVTDRMLDLVLVAALELAPDDAEVRGLVADACRALRERLPSGAEPADQLGRRLLQRGGLPAAAPDRHDERQTWPRS